MSEQLSAKILRWLYSQGIDHIPEDNPEHVRHIHVDIQDFGPVANAMAAATHRVEHAVANAAVEQYEQELFNALTQVADAEKQIENLTEALDRVNAETRDMFTTRYKEGFKDGQAQAGTLEQFLQYVKVHNRIDALKMLRKETGLSLVPAKAIVDFIWDKLAEANIIVP